MGKLLINSTRNELVEFDLDSGQMTEVAKISDPNDFASNNSNLEKVDEDRFLFEMFFGGVGIYSISDHQKNILFDNGICPVYFEDTGEMLFSNSSKTTSGFENYLSIFNLEDGNLLKLKKLVMGMSSTCPVKLNGHQAIIILSHDKKYNYKIAHFDAKRRVFSEKMIWPFKPRFSLSNNRLLCLCFHKGLYLISDFKGQKLIEIGHDILDKNNMFVVASFKEINSILVHEYRERIFRDRISNIWLVDLGTMKKRLIAEDFNIRMKGAIYLN